MELKVDIPALAGQDIDPTTFQRVWNRVMPDQPAPRNDAVPPASIPDTAVPAEPSLPPEDASPTERPSVPDCPADSVQRPPVPDCPADSIQLPPVPDCPADSTQRPPVPDCPADSTQRPPIPSCPAQPECPSCPETPVCPECPTCPETPVCPECPACPETPTTPPTVSAPSLCLGEASQGDAARLEALMSLARVGTIAGQALCRRASGSCARTLNALTRDHRSAFRRLSAAYFLITGTRYTPKCAAPTLPASLALALRQQFVWEQRWEQQNKQAAQATSDPCLKELYLELAQEGALHAGCIRSLLEQMG